MAGCSLLLFFCRGGQEARISAGCVGVLAVKRFTISDIGHRSWRRPSSPELAVFRLGAIGEIEIDAAAAALCRGKLSQSPPFGLEPGAETGPRGWSGQPAQLGKAVGEQRIANQPAAVDADPGAAARHSGIDFAKNAHDGGQFVRSVPRAVDAEINRTASRLRILGGEHETSLSVLTAAQFGERPEFVVLVLEDDAHLEAVHDNRVAFSAPQCLAG